MQNKHGMKYNILPHKFAGNAYDMIAIIVEDLFKLKW